MPHYAILAPAYTGHLNPLTVLARALMRRGHRVTMLSVPDAAEKMQRAGLDFAPIASTEFSHGEWQALAAHAGERTGLKATASAGRAIALLARGVLRDLPEIARRMQFDGLVMDQICVGTESVCEVINLPLAVACGALAFHIESGVPPAYFAWRRKTALHFRARNWLGQFAVNMCGLGVLRELGPYRFKHRLRPMGPYYINELTPSLVQVAQQPAFFDFPRRHLPDHFHYTAPWIEDRAEEQTAFPWERLDGRPLIYASLGTMQNKLASIYDLIAEACTGLDAQLVLSLGGHGAAAPMRQPDNALIVDYAPQTALLRRASLVITHGGLNTVLESLSAGVPLVVTPIANDQPGNAMRLEHLGAGRFIPLRYLEVNSLRAAITDVLRTPALAERARFFATELARWDGPSLAAGLIEQAFLTRKRITRTARADAGAPRAASNER